VLDRSGSIGETLAVKGRSESPAGRAVERHQPMGDTPDRRCGEEAAPSAEQRQRAQAAGFDVDLVYVTEVDGYTLAAGGSGVYGDAGYQAIYSSSRGDDLRLTVERRSLDDGTCAALPVPGAEQAAQRCSARATTTAGPGSPVIGGSTH
jgi:hypothetical protein